MRHIACRACGRVYHAYAGAGNLTIAGEEGGMDGIYTADGKTACGDECAGEGTDWHFVPIDTGTPTD